MQEGTDGSIVPGRFVLRDRVQQQAIRVPLVGHEISQESDAAVR